MAELLATQEPAAPVATPGVRIAGIDEAGRGPLAGPVVVAAVVFDPARPRINGLADSKQLCASRREFLYARIVERALAWHVVFIDVEDIDRINIYHATMLGMRRALEGVVHAVGGPDACIARIDGNALPRDLPCRAEAWIGGDARERSIMAASILAKVSRDRWMRELHATHPQYGFDQHKGYSTPSHLAALRTHGPCPQHRTSFAPVRAMQELRQGVRLQDGCPAALPATRSSVDDDCRRLQDHLDPEFGLQDDAIRLDGVVER